MRLILVAIFLSFTPFILAKSTLPASCSSFEEVIQSDLILLKKREFIELGECVGIALLKENRLKNLPEICSEVIENKLTPLGGLSLSKLEAIKIGQCTGIINYVYERYDSKTLKYDYSDEMFHCVKGIQAAKILTMQSDNYQSVKKVSDVLCEYY